MAEQIDKGALRQYVSQAQKKQYKKEHTRKMRRVRKDVNQPNPIHNKYNGWAV